MSVSLFPESSAPDAQKWRDFVAASPHGDVLQCLEWGPVKTPEYSPIPVSIEGENGFSATCLVLKKALPLGKCYFYLSRGPILDWSDENLARAMFDKLRELGKKHGTVFIRTDPCVLDERAEVKALLQKLGFIASPDAGSIFGGLQPRCNMKMDISASLDDILMHTIKANWRRNIRVSEKHHIRVEDNLGRDGLKIFHEIYKVTSERNGFKGYSLAYFEKMWDSLAPSNLIKLFVSFNGDKPLSAAICFLLPPQCWYMFGASSNEDRNLMPNHAMQWKMISWAKANDCTTYDFRGVPDPNLHEIPAHEEGLVKFKTGFGAEMVRYIGEYDLVLDKTAYWAFTSAKPKLRAAFKKLKK